MLADASHALSWPPLSEVVDVLTFQAGYNTSLVVIGTFLLGIAAGPIGTFALLRKRSLMADAGVPVQLAV